MMLKDIKVWVYRCVQVCVCVSAGGDQGRFEINNRTGEIRLTRAVDDQRLGANFTLRVMVTTLLPVSFITITPEQKV